MKHGWAVLYWAAQEGHKAVVQLLLEKGTDITAEDENRRTALYWATLKGHDSVMQLSAREGDLCCRGGPARTERRNSRWLIKDGNSLLETQTLGKICTVYNYVNHSTVT